MMMMMMMMMMKGAYLYTEYKSNQLDNHMFFSELDY